VRAYGRLDDGSEVAEVGEWNILGEACPVSKSGSYWGHYVLSNRWLSGLFCYCH
jgi:hypothetical protein